MTLGEALTNRADLQKRIAQLASRLQASGVVQEGDAPPEDPAQLLAELGELTSELERLITAINLTNAASSTSRPCAARSMIWPGAAASSTRRSRSSTGRRS
jgi:hypothetical protein